MTWAGIELKLEDEIAERFEGTSFQLNRCSLKACSLSCETTVTVATAENEDGQAFGNELAIRMPVDGGTMEALCQRHDKDGSTSSPIDAITSIGNIGFRLSKENTVPVV